MAKEWVVGSGGVLRGVGVERGYIGVGIKLMRWCLLRVSKGVMCGWYVYGAG